MSKELSCNQDKRESCWYLKLWLCFNLTHIQQSWYQCKQWPQMMNIILMSF